MRSKYFNVTVPIGSCFVYSSIVYKCVEDDFFHGCSHCAFCAAHEEGGVCSGPLNISCSPPFRHDGKDVRFEEVGEFFSIDGSLHG